MYAPTLEKTVLKLESAALTERGQKRQLNEDAVFQHTVCTCSGDCVGLYLVCDGLGGHEAGEVASRTAVRTLVGELGWLFSTFEEAAELDISLLTTDTLSRWIQMAVVEANRKIRAFIQEALPPDSKTATTLTMALVYGRTALVANVGDSRTYLWRNGRLFQITRDHSLVAELVKNGVVAPEKQAHHDLRNVISRALGSDDAVDVDIFKGELKAGDKLLLCSDGLWQAFPDRDELAMWLDSDLPADEVCWQLVDEANCRDGSDNISAVVVCTEETAVQL